MSQNGGVSYHLEKNVCCAHTPPPPPPPTPTVCAWNVEYKSSQVTIKYVLLLVLKVPMSELPVNNEGK